MIFSTNANLWAIAGVVYALAGASLLCNSVFLTPAPDRAVGDDAFSRRRRYEQWLDARIGAVLIVIGFFLQATGGLGTETLKTPAVFVLLALGLAATYYGLVKESVIEDLIAVDERPRQEKPLALVRPVAPVATPIARASESEEPQARVQPAV